MKIYKLEISIIDFDGLGEQGIINTIEGTRYPNWCISPKVENIDSRDIGEWDDDHPLNKNDTCKQEYQRLFNGEPK